jgi:iron-sulfur cluster assembly protein
VTGDLVTGDPVTGDPVTGDPATEPGAPVRAGRELRIDVTPRAARQVRAMLDRPDGPDGAGPPARCGLRVELEPAQGATNQYRLSLSPDPLPEELVLPRHGFDIFVRAADTAQLDGLRIDFVASPAAQGFTLDRLPNPPRGPRPGQAGRSLPGGAPLRSGDPPGAAHVERDGEPDEERDEQLEQRVEAALAEVRPALLADGGDVDLVGVSDGTAHVRLVGACSGCPVAMGTLIGLVERVVVAAVAEIDRVVLAGAS